MALDVDPAGVDLGWVRSSLQFHPPRDVTRHRTLPHRTTPASHLVLHPFQQSFLALPRPAGVVPVPDTVPLQLFLRGHGFVLLAINTTDEVVAFVQGVKVKAATNEK